MGAGEYKPLSSDDAAVLIAQIKQALPPWVRLQRIQRDIPVKHIVDGVIKSNVRQLSCDILRNSNQKCRCIRCREIGHKVLQGSLPDPAAVGLHEHKMNVCGGAEHFLSFEDESIDALVGFLRLRFPASPFRSELEDAAVVRELHVYGRMVPIGENNDAWQHQGYGKKLLARAEEIAADGGYRKLAVISGIGARLYYQKLGYEYDGPYMSKRLK